MPIQKEQNEVESKLEAFVGTMLGDAIEDSHSILLELHEKEREIIAKATGDIIADAGRYKKTKFAEIKARESRRISSRMTENKRCLLEYRETCAISAFTAAREKIKTFTESEAYLPHLKSLLSQALGVFGYGFSAEVFLRPQDMRFSEELLNSTSGVSLAFSEGNFAMGGLCVYCSAQSKQVDMSFDAALTDMVGHFAEITDLQVVGD